MAMSFNLNNKQGMGCCECHPERKPRRKLVERKTVFCRECIKRKCEGCSIVIAPKWARGNAPKGKWQRKDFAPSDKYQTLCFLCGERREEKGDDFDFHTLLRKASTGPKRVNYRVVSYPHSR